MVAGIDSKALHQQRFSEGAGGDVTLEAQHITARVGRVSCRGWHMCCRKTDAVAPCFEQTVRIRFGDVLTAALCNVNSTMSRVKRPHAKLR